MMKKTQHPGELLRNDVIDELGLSVKKAAELLGVSDENLSLILNSQAAISPDLALRLEIAGFSTARAWLAMQANYDLALAKQSSQSPTQI